MEPEYDNFVGEARQRHTFTERGPAEDAIHAVLRTLGEVLPEDLSIEVAAFLPDEVADFLLEPAQAEGLDLTEFLDRVAEREDDEITSDQALKHAQIVVGLMAEMAPDDEIERMRENLPGLEPIFEIAEKHMSGRQTA